MTRRELVIIICHECCQKAQYLIESSIFVINRGKTPSYTAKVAANTKIFAVGGDSIAFRGY